jgi:hypothetical protein
VPYWLTGLRSSPTSCVVVGLASGFRSDSMTVPCRARDEPLVGGGWLSDSLTRPEHAVTQPRTVADVLADHVVSEVECIDRVYCNVVPAAAARRWAARLHPREIVASSGCPSTR